MPYRRGVYDDKLPDAETIMGDHNSQTRCMDTEVNSRPRKRQTLKPRLASTNELYELLRCPVCSNMMYPPIFQCPSGHILCQNCKQKVSNNLCPCSSCVRSLGNIRCLALEKVAESLEFSCRHRPLGCQDVTSYYEKIKHEEQCRFRPYNCPYAGSECSVTGDIATLITHLTDHHKVDMHMGSTFNHRYVNSNPLEVEHATWMLTVFKCFGKYFLLHFEAFLLGAAPVYIAFLRFMGEAEEASGFRYTLEVSGNQRKQLWQGLPRSIRDCHQTVRDSMDGLIVPRQLALYFSGDGADPSELKLRVMGQIWKEQ